MCFLWVSEDVRQQNPYAGLIVLNKQKYQADKILSEAPPPKNEFIDNDLRLEACSKRREA